MNEGALIAAAARVLARHGPGGLTIDRVAEESGISRATLYRRGVRKERLLAGAYDEVARRYRDAIWPALTASGAARDRLQAAIRALCATADEHLGLLAGLYDQPHTVFHDHTDQQTLVREPFAEPFERILRDGQLDGTLHVDDPVETATVLFNLVAWTYIHLRHAHRWDADRTLAHLLAIILDGLARPAPERAT